MLVVREIQKASVSECNWKEGFVQTLDWQVTKDENTNNNENFPSVYLDDSVNLRISPDRKRFVWNESHFHSSLKIPSSESSTANNNNDGNYNNLMVLFQAKARECLTVVLSPDPTFSKQCMYEIQLGATGNSVTTIRRWAKQKRNMASASIPSRVCDDQAWVSYWIIYLADDNKIYAGVGSTPGDQCIGVLDAPFSIPAAAKLPTATTTQEMKGNDEGNEEQAAPTNSDDSKEQQREGKEAETKVDATTTMDTTDDKPPVIKYVGFGNSAKGPKAQPLNLRKVILTTVPSAVVERLASLPTTSDDLPYVVVDGNQEMKHLMEEYKKECQLRKTRAKKFGTAYKEPTPDAFLPWSKAKRLRENPEKGFITGLDLMDPGEVLKRNARKDRFGIKDDNNGNDNETAKEGEAVASKSRTDKRSKNDLLATQAWDKEKMLRPQRKDPPMSLWKPAPLESLVEQRDTFAMEDPEPTTSVPEKIHLFAIDWAAFKQIRNKDIMAYFSTYGPSYVEWLADLSCNVCFEDRHSASRAMMSLSQDIPSPPPEDVKQEDGDQLPSDFGNMMWRFCRTPLRKVANDKYGRRGTTARVLMRAALSTDILEDRPNSWPAPPGGFSSTKVLGPESDFSKGRQKKKRRRGSGAQPKAKEQHDAYGVVETGEHPLLTRGLSAGRQGFSVEELEQERAKKRAKATGSSDS